MSAGERAVGAMAPKRPVRECRGAADAALFGTGAAMHFVEPTENAFATEEVFGDEEPSDMVPRVSACRAEHVCVSPSLKSAAVPREFRASGLGFVPARRSVSSAGHLAPLQLDARSRPLKGNEHA
ncbi:hypothetical protein ACIO93_25820 [Streptomyces sp. NPDC087903]|uniref:hypothetical protein n=1 Tax=Streptomyces sp. NPDC087903 TaxID=3365819 RepID=UPI00382A28B1